MIRLGRKMIISKALPGTDEKINYFNTNRHVILPLYKEDIPILIKALTKHKDSSDKDKTDRLLKELGDICL